MTIVKYYAFGKTKNRISLVVILAYINGLKFKNFLLKLKSKNNN